LLFFGEIADILYIRTDDV